MDEPVKTESKEILETREAKRQREEVCAKINAIISEAPADMTFIFAVHNGGGAATKVFSRQGKQAVMEAFGGIVMRINKLFGE